MSSSSLKKDTSILIVDDDAMVREMLAEILKGEGYTVSSAEDGKTALEKISGPSHFDVLISDMNMPRMGGMELIKNVRQQGDETPIIVLTSSNETTTAIEAIKLGAWDYLLKDENIPDTVLFAIDHILEKQKFIEEKRSAEALIKKQNQELAIANTQLQELNQLKNKFVGVAAIDLRNPLYLIQSFSEALLDSSLGEINEKQSHYLKKIFQASKFMSSLLADLLNFTKIESGKIKLDINEEDLTELIENQVEINQLAANKKNITIRTDFGDIPPVFIDRNAILQVLDNFIGNAIKFSPLDTSIVIHSALDGDEVRVSIQDQGPGMSEEEKTLLFSEFRTQNKNSPGNEKSTGLGLFIVKNLVLLHKGKVDVTSEPGKGSTFYFTIPLNQ